jgi:hypothetical protein
MGCRKGFVLNLNLSDVVHLHLASLGRNLQRSRSFQQTDLATSPTVSLAYSAVLLDCMVQSIRISIPVETVFFSWCILNSQFADCRS